MLDHEALQVPQDQLAHRVYKATPEQLVFRDVLEIQGPLDLKVHVAKLEILGHKAHMDFGATLAHKAM
jgi:hypothetical protein